MNKHQLISWLWDYNKNQSLSFKTKVRTMSLIRVLSDDLLSFISAAATKDGKVIFTWFIPNESDRIEFIATKKETSLYKYNKGRLYKKNSWENKDPDYIKDKLKEMVL